MRGAREAVCTLLRSGARVQRTSVHMRAERGYDEADGSVSAAAYARIERL